jgi:hypothetical protein
MLQRIQSESSNQYKVNTYHYINYQDYVCTCTLFAASAWNKKWKKNNENVKYEHRMWSRMLYRTIDFVLFACKRPRMLFLTVWNKMSLIAYKMKKI